MRLLALWMIGGFLSVFSLVVLKSISPELVDKQFWFFCGGWLGCFVLTRLPEVIYRRLLPLGYGVLVLVLLVLLIVGDRTRGTTGWFELGNGLKIQPSQFAVPLVMTFLINQFGERALAYKRLALVMATAFIPGLLILLEPDFGTGMVYFLSMAGLLFAWGLPRKFLLGVTGVALFSFFLMWVAVFKPYQKDRIIGFLKPTMELQQQEETSAQYNARQALIAVGSGGFWGKGLGQGVQSHLRFLPERQTDFIFASLSEETGFVGSMAVVIAYAGLVAWLSSWYRQSRSDRTLLLFGFSVYFLIQAGINIGMNIGLLPITGITLPLLSYGGSSIFATCLAFGLIFRQMRADKPKVVIKIS